LYKKRAKKESREIPTREANPAKPTNPKKKQKQKKQPYREILNFGGFFQHGVQFRKKLLSVNVNGTDNERIYVASWPVYTQSVRTKSEQFCTRINC
jgi:hypothetical protein